jgi:hypothetical protein
MFEDDLHGAVTVLSPLPKRRRPAEGGAIRRLGGDDGHPRLLRPYNKRPSCDGELGGETAAGAWGLASTGTQFTCSVTPELAT